MNINNLAALAKKASIKLSVKTIDEKNNALKCIADALTKHVDEIAAANQIDLKNAATQNLAAPLLKRLKFDAAKVSDVVEGIRSLIKLDDPVGQKLSQTMLDEGLVLTKESCPIGVIGVIFESRPDALVQISTLALKSGNAVLLKGGSEALETNRILASIVNSATAEAGFPQNWMTLLETRSDVNELLKCDKYVNLIIPRGSNEFVKYIMHNSNIPVLGHADGICHCYVDEAADIAKAVCIVNDSKTQYVAVCNATETLLVHDKIAGGFLPLLKSKLQEKNVKIKGCEKTCKIINVELADETDWSTEYLDYTLSIKVVSSLDESIEHINTYGSGHTDAIITEDKNSAEYFMNMTDSGNVFWNCSTRFSDGFRYGFGAEVGVSTNKIHARGPVGLEGLIIYKYKLIGNGHIVSDYSEGKKIFIHKKM